MPDRDNANYYTDPETGEMWDISDPRNPRKLTRQEIERIFGTPVTIGGGVSGGETSGDLADRLERELRGGGGGPPGQGDFGATSPPTSDPGTGRMWKFESSAGIGGTWVSVPDPNYGSTGKTAQDIARMEQERAQFELEQQRLDAQIAQNMRRDISDREARMGKPQPTDIPTDVFGRKAFWDGDRWQYPPDWNKDPATVKAGYISPAEQKRLDLEAQQLANTQAWQQGQLQMEKERQLASLRASPASWLEYASLAGQPAVVQPWMKGLLPQSSNLSVGQALPGFNAGAQRMNLPELTRPSQQYLARIGPAPTQQFFGYEQARTGAPPEQTAWWLGELAAPGGRFSGLSRRR